MKQYKFNLEKECMEELPSPESNILSKVVANPKSISNVVNHFIDLQSIPVPKKYLSSFIDGKVYNEDEFEICKYQGETYAVSIPKQKVDDTEMHFLNLGFEIKFIKNELLPPNTAMVSKDIYEILKNKYQKQ